MTRILPFFSAGVGLWMFIQANHWLLETETKPWICFFWGAFGTILVIVSVVFRR